MYATTDQFLASGFNIYSHHWRDTGLMFAYIAFNVGLAFFPTPTCQSTDVRSWKDCLHVHIHIHLPDTNGGVFWLPLSSLSWCCFEEEILRESKPRKHCIGPLELGLDFMTLQLLKKIIPTPNHSYTLHVSLWKQLPSMRPLKTD